jgi:hypothetical protein
MKYWLKRFWHRIVDVPDYDYDFSKAWLAIPQDYIESIEVQPRQIIINLNHDLLIKTSTKEEKEV